MNVKILANLSDLPRFWGPVATVTCTIIYHLGSIAFGYSPAVMPLVIFLVLGSLSGLRPGLICAVWISGYAVYAIDDLSRVVQIAIGAVSVAFITGWQTRALRQALTEALAGAEARKMVDTLNGNIIRITEARELILDILNHNNLDENTRSRLRSALHTMNNLQFATKGWAELRAIKAELGRGGAND